MTSPATRQHPALDASSVLEIPLIMTGSQGPLFGILSRPTAQPATGILIVAGQPQTRVGAHRMFVTLARGLALRGIAALRFDCGGWGDSPGEPLPFEQSAQDIGTAARQLREQLGPEAKLVVFGLCDGASAAILALPSLSTINVDALGLVNPWVRSEEGHAQAILTRYYTRRFLQPELWSRLFRGKISLSNLIAPLGFWRTSRQKLPKPVEPTGSLPDQLLRELSRYSGPVWTVLSGDDLTAAETEALLKQDADWQRALQSPPSFVFRVAHADHTLTTGNDWERVIDWLAQNCHGLRSVP